jgi:hypothetical protein
MISAPRATGPRIYPKLAAGLVLALLLSSAATACAQIDSQLSAQAIFWSTSNLASYNQYVAYARHGAAPQVPVPPMVDPPCHVCGDTTAAQGETQVATWITQSEAPEVTDINGLLAMDKQVQAYTAQFKVLSPAAQKALGQFEDDAGFMSDAGKLADRLLTGKAIPMAQRYDSEPKQAYAGISFLLAVSKVASLIQGSNSSTQGDQVIQLAQTWEQSISDKIDSDVASGHKYNLCPVYAEIIRTVELLGGPQTNTATFAKMLDKLQKIVTFDLYLNLNVKINGNDGSHMYAAWAGQGRFQLTLDLVNSCYTPAFQESGKIDYFVPTWDMTSVQTDPSGHKKTVPVELVSSHSSFANLGPPQLNLCDPEPIFQVPLASISLHSPEVLRAHGQDTQMSLMASFMGAVVAANEVNSAKTNALTGDAPSLPPGTSPSASTTPTADSKALDAAKQALNSHKGDVGWLTSPAGQAAIADIQKQALQMTQSKTAAAGVVAPTATSFAGLAQNLSSVHLPWTNGSAQPVNKTLHVKKDDTDITLTIIVQQSPQ